ncbi:aldo/keto reductase [Streptomyces sp. NPDC056930]|uniref:aldo/keto reductase n=1 Tax=Streptomyces sp. NPDC056930 TaxID=3345967 RepID=UPI003633ADE8
MGKLTELAESEGAAHAQLALAWLLAKKDYIVPIPDLRNPHSAAQNIAAADLMPTGRGASGGRRRCLVCSAHERASSGRAVRDVCHQAR